MLQFVLMLNVFIKSLTIQFTKILRYFCTPSGISMHALTILSGLLAVKLKKSFSSSLINLDLIIERNDLKKLWKVVKSFVNTGIFVRGIKLFMFTAIKVFIMSVIEIGLAEFDIPTCRDKGG